MQSLRAGQRSCAAQGSRGSQPVTSHCATSRRPFSSSQSSAFGCALSSATQAGLPGQSSAQPSQPIVRAARGSSTIVCQAALADKMTVAITGALILRPMCAAPVCRLCSINQSAHLKI